MEQPAPQLANQATTVLAPTRAAIRNQIFHLAWPVIVENTLMTLVGMADMIQVGGLGPAAIAAVGLSNSPIFFAQAGFAAVSVGSTAIIARHIGAKEPDQANAAARQSFYLSIIFGALFTIGIMLLAPFIMGWMGAEPDVAQYGTSYIRISTSTFAFAIISMIMNGALRGAGDTKTPMRVNIIANLVNVVFNYLLINGIWFFPRMGVDGAAAATALSRAVGGILVLRVLFTGQALISVDWREKFQINWEIINRMMKIGIPAAVEQLIMRGGQLAFTRVVSSLGTIAYAAHSVAMNAESLSFMPGFGFAMAATTLIGQNLGAKKPDWAEESGYESVRIAASIMGFLGLIFLIWPYPFTRLYTSDLNVIHQASAALRIVAIAQPAMAVSMVLSGGLRGAGDTKWVLYITIAGVWGVRLTVGYLLAIVFRMGLIGAWIGMTADIFVRAVLIFLRYRHGHWKTLKV